MRIFGYHINPAWVLDSLFEQRNRLEAALRENVRNYALAKDDLRRAEEELRSLTATTDPGIALTAEGMAATIRHHLRLLNDAIKEADASGLRVEIGRLNMIDMRNGEGRPFLSATILKKF